MSLDAREGIVHSPEYVDKHGVVRILTACAAPALGDTPCVCVNGILRRIDCAVGTRVPTGGGEARVRCSDVSVPMPAGAVPCAQVGARMAWTLLDALLVVRTHGETQVRRAVAYACAMVFRWGALFKGHLYNRNQLHK